MEMILQINSKQLGQVEKIMTHLRPKHVLVMPILCLFGELLH